MNVLYRCLLFFICIFQISWGIGQEKYSFRITVLDQDSLPIEQAKVKIENTSSAMWLETDRNGICTYKKQIKPGNVSILVTKKGYSPQIVPAGASSETDDNYAIVILERPDTLVVSGYVLQNDREGIANATVSINIGPLRKTVISDQLGYYRQSFLKKEITHTTIKIKATHPDFRPMKTPSSVRFQPQDLRKKNNAYYEKDITLTKRNTNLTPIDFVIIGGGALGIAAAVSGTNKYYSDAKPLYADYKMCTKEADFLAKHTDFDSREDAFNTVKEMRKNALILTGSGFTVAAGALLFHLLNKKKNKKKK